MDIAVIKLYTIQEAARLLRVHRSTLSRLVKAGELRHVSVGSRKLVRHQDLLAFIDSRIGEDGDSGLLSENKSWRQ